MGETGAAGPMDATTPSRSWPRVALVLFPAHLVFTALTLGLRWDHVAADALMLGLTWAGPRGARFTLAFLPLWLTGVAYESFKLVAHLRGPIHVADLYAAELRWFGIEGPSGPRIPQDYFLDHHWVALDLACGFAYLAYLYEPMVIGIYFYLRRPERLAPLVWGFLALNLLGMATYLLYPAAPPWYVQKYGLGPVQLDAPPDPAGASRFDALLGIRYFEAFYSRSSNVFGAVPSLHAAYPVLCLLAIWPLSRLWRAVGALFAFLVAFAAVYLRHHYILDVLLGWLYGAIAYGLAWAGAARVRGRGRAGESPGS